MIPLLLTTILLMAVGTFFLSDMMGEHGGQPCVFRVMQQTECSTNAMINMALVHATHHWQVLQSMLSTVSIRNILAALAILGFMLLWRIVRFNNFNHSQNHEPCAGFWLRHQHETIFFWIAPQRAWTVRTQDLQ